MPKKRGKAPDFTEEQLTLLRAAADEVAALKKIKTQREMGVALGVEQQTAGRFWKGRGSIGVHTANRLVQHLNYENVFKYFDAMKRDTTRATSPLGLDPKLIGDLSPEQLEAMRYAKLEPFRVPMSVIVKVNDFYGTAKHTMKWWMTKYLEASEESQRVEKEVVAAPPPEEHRVRRRAR